MSEDHDVLNLPLAVRRGYEQERYEALHRKDRLYGATNHGSAAREFLLRQNVISLLDVGCGDNSFAKWFRGEGVMATGCDFADPRADVICPAHDLPFPDDHFDWVTSFDCLEHLWPDEVDQVLKEFQRVGSQGLLVSISYVPAVTKAPGGNLHRTVQPEEWWIEKLSRVLKSVERHKHYLTGIFRS